MTACALGAVSASAPAAPLWAPHGVVREYAALAPAADASPLKPLLDVPLADASIAAGPDGAFYLTGSDARGRGPSYSAQIAVWRSPDMRQWQLIRRLDAGCGVRAPEIHFLKGRFWMTLGLEGGGTELLRFETAELAVSPFRRARITAGGSDPSLFLDDDGVFYWVTGGGVIARMKSEPMDGLAGEGRTICVKIAGPDQRTGAQRCEDLHGAFLAKIAGKYHLFVTGRITHRGFARTGAADGIGDVLAAASDRPDGAFSDFYVAFPNAGQTTLFRDGKGAWWATYSGEGERAVFRDRPGAFPVDIVPATEPRWPIGFSGLEKPTRFPFGIMLRPDPAFIYENGVGLARAIPMDKVPGQKADVEWIRDTCIALGPDGVYYMTGTSGDMQGICLWKSPDLKRFSFVKMVWSPDPDPWRWYNQKPGRLFWAPELHFINGTYWIPWCASGGVGNSLLKSASGRPEGPYVPAFRDDGPVDQHIDASLFQDDDGAVYYVWQDGLIRRLNAAMDGFDGPADKLLTTSGEHVGYEGIYLRRMGPWYVASAAEWCGGGNRSDGSYDMTYAVSKSLLGPYSARRVAVPHAGHGMLLRDKSGRWCAAMFGNDRSAPFRAMPGVVPLDITDTGGDLLIRPAAR